MELCDTLPTIVAFTAKNWCGPCQRLEPELMKLKDNLKFHFLQCDDSEVFGKQQMLEFGIGGFPTLMIYVPKINKFIICNKRDAISIGEYACKLQTDLTPESYIKLANVYSSHNPCGNVKLHPHGQCK